MSELDAALAKALYDASLPVPSIDTVRAWNRCRVFIAEALAAGNPEFDCDAFYRGTEGEKP